jgi:hypothetical protein
MNRFRNVSGWIAVQSLLLGGLSVGTQIETAYAGEMPADRSAPVVHALLIADADRASMIRPELLRHWELLEQRMNVRTGEIQAEVKRGDYDTLPECSAAQVGRIGQVHGDAVQVWTCRHDANEKSI